MRTSLRSLILIASIAAIGMPLRAEDTATTGFKPIVSTIDLKDGDTLVFLGDSITHQCLYTQYVEDFFYTRYPQKRLHFPNAGVSGDRAKNALDRFDEDVAALKPRYVTVLLGMNDGAYRDFDKTVFDTYQQDMNKDRNEQAYHPLRDQWAQLKGKRRDIEKLTQANDRQIEAKKAECKCSCPETIS